MKNYVEFIVKQLVDKPEEVKVTEVQSERVTVFELRVGDGDMGKVIGRRGQNASALRTLINAVAANPENVLF